MIQGTCFKGRFPVFSCFFLCSLFFFPVCSSSPMRASTARVEVRGFNICISSAFHFVSFLGVGARRLRSGGSRFSSKKKKKKKKKPRRCHEELKNRSLLTLHTLEINLDLFPRGGTHILPNDQQPHLL